MVNTEDKRFEEYMALIRGCQRHGHMMYEDIFRSLSERKEEKRLQDLIEFLKTLPTDGESDKENNRRIIDFLESTTPNQG